MARFARNLSLLFACGGAVAVGAAACNGTGSGGGGPTPTPSGSPAGCLMEWSGPGPGSSINVYRLVMTASRWLTAGTNDYADTANVAGVFYYAVPSSAALLTQAARMYSTSNGSFMVADGGLTVGGSVSFTDTTAQRYFVMTTAYKLAAYAGSGGTGSFNGVWSDPNATGGQIVPGTGSVVFTLAGSALSLGSFSYAKCFLNAPPATLLKPARGGGASRR